MFADGDVTPLTVDTTTCSAGQAAFDPYHGTAKAVAAARHWGNYIPATTAHAFNPVHDCTQYGAGNANSCVSISTKKAGFNALDFTTDILPLGAYADADAEGTYQGPDLTRRPVQGERPLLGRRVQLEHRQHQRHDDAREIGRASCRERV